MSNNPDRVCTQCHATKPLNEFYSSFVARDNAIRCQSECKECTKARKAAYLKAHPDRDKATRKAHYEKNRARRVAESCTWQAANKGRVRTNYLKRNYKLSTEQYDAMLKGQGYQCACCRVTFSEDQKPAVDHCHKTGKVRGLLCANCNRAIGLLYDNPETMLRLADYLVDPPLSRTH